MSLRVRLLLAVGVVALVGLLAADLATYSALRSFLYHRVDQSLDAAHVPLERQIEGGDQDAYDETAMAAIAPGTYVEVRDASGTTLGSTPGHLRGGAVVEPKVPADIGQLTPPEGPGEAHRYFTVPSLDSGGPDFRVRASSLPSGATLIVALPLDEVSATLHRLVGIELLVSTAALVVAVALGWWLVRIGLRPLSDVEDTAIAITDGDLDRNVPGENPKTEVGRLARALNVMLDRIREAFAARDTTEAELRRNEEQLRTFVADASHELRTPLAAVSAYAELFDRGANDHPDDLARVMSGIRTETARMGELVEDLLLLAHLDEGQPLEREPVELVTLAAQAVESARTVGPDWPLRFDAREPLEVVGDAKRLRQVLDNLLSNVRAHTPRGTAATVRVGSVDGHALLEVADEGPGLSEEQQHRVFERFYRTEASRSRSSGGSGLGLSIVSAIVEAQGGHVRVSGAPGRGTTFSIELPLADGAGGEPDSDPTSGAN